MASADEPSNSRFLGVSQSVQWVIGLAGAFLLFAIGELIVSQRHHEQRMFDLVERLTLLEFAAERVEQRIYQLEQRVRSVEGSVIMLKKLSLPSIKPDPPGPP